MTPKQKKQEDKIIEFEDRELLEDKYEWNKGIVRLYLKEIIPKILPELKEEARKYYWDTKATRKFKGTFIDYLKQKYEN